MKRVTRIALSLCLALLMFPTAALAEGARDTGALAAADAQLQAAATQPVGPSDAPAGTPVGDARHVTWKTLGTKERHVPEAEDFHDAFGVNMAYGYPDYNSSFNAKVKGAGGTDADAEAQERAVYEESAAILDYTSMDADGNLYKDGEPKAPSADGKTVTRLVRHTAGVENYGQAIGDDVESTTRLLSMRMLRYGNLATGLYAPPGEVVKVTLRATSADRDAKDLGLRACIGNFGGNDENHTIDNLDKYNLTRMPNLGKVLALDNEVNYIGSPLGGAILISSTGIGATTVEMEIEGAVEMPTYFYGEMSDEELAEQLQKPAPYFAFSTPRGIRGVGPATLLQGRTAQQVRKAMEFWDKAVGVSYQFEAGKFDANDPDTNLMVEMFDPHIPSGSAMNANGNFCICPISWGDAFLDGDALMTEGHDSFWGDIHELNHSYYWGGAADGSTEIANNVISSLTYQLYTNIAAKRTESSWAREWEWCSDAYTTVENIRQNTNNWGNLGVYVPVQHAFGADAFIDAVHAYHENGGKAGGVGAGNPRHTNANVWLYASSEATGHDMTYYLRDVLRDRTTGTGLFPQYDGERDGESDYLTDDVVGEVQGKPVFIPSGCLYASGFVYGAGTGDERVVEMGRPFRIPYGKTKLLNFNRSVDGGFISVANGEEVEMLGHTEPQHGTLAATDDPMKLLYTPDGGHLDDCFYVTVRLTVTSGGYAGSTQDVTYKVSLLQDTAQVGFATAFYDWPNELRQYADPVGQAVADGVPDRTPSSIQVEGAGFDASKADVGAGRLAVVDGTIALPKTGEVDLYTRGNVYYSTCVAAAPEGLPPAADAQSKSSANLLGGYDTSREATHIKVYVVPQGGDGPANPGDYAAVVHEGEPLYLRAYVVMPRDCTCAYRIGYLDGGTVRDFDAAALSEPVADGVETAPVSDYPTGKSYSYPDPAIQETSLHSYLKPDAAIRSAAAYELTEAGAVALAARSGTAGDIIDGDLATQFHGRVSGAGSYAAEFVFELAEAASFNSIVYKGHSTYKNRGKIKDYEVYVGDDEEALRGAGADSDLCVAKGTASQDPDFDAGDMLNVIEFGRAATGKYLRLVARSAYPSNGQYYYALSDLTVGTYTSIGGTGTVATCNRVGDWSGDDRPANTRSPLRVSANGLGWIDFNGTGIIVYSTTASDFGTMRVDVDGQAADVSLNSPGTLSQQPVFWKTGLDASRAHRLTFSPKTPGTDAIDVDSVEVKGTPDGLQPAVPAAKSLSAQATPASLPYSGGAVEPAVAVRLDGMDVTGLCDIAFADNVEPGTATATARLHDDAGPDLTAQATFTIEAPETGKTDGTGSGEPGSDGSGGAGGTDDSGGTNATGSGTGAGNSEAADSGTGSGGDGNGAGDTNAGAGSTSDTAEQPAYTLKPIALKTAKTYPRSLTFPKQAVSGAGSAAGITFDVYVRQAKSGAKWVRKLGNVTPAGMKRKARTIGKLSPRKTYRYQVRAKRKVAGKIVATSTWTSGKIKTGANIRPAVKSAKASRVRVVKRGGKPYTSYRLTVTLKKRLGNGTAGVMTSSGKYAKGKGRTFSLTFKNVPGNKKGKKATLILRGYSSKAYGGYTNPSKALKYRIT